MNNSILLPFTNKMVCVAVMAFGVLVVLGTGTTYQIQDRVSQTDSMVNIGIGRMISFCHDQPEKKPQVNSFTFNFWTGDRCYITLSKEELPVLFNFIVSTTQSCRYPCTQTLPIILPEIACPDATFPNTFSVTYTCGSEWQTPFTSTTSTTTSTTTTTVATTTATTTTTTTPAPTTTTPTTTTTAVPTTTTPTTTTPTTTTPTTTTPTTTTTTTAHTTTTTTSTTTTPTTTTSTTTTPTTTTTTPTTTTAAPTTTTAAPTTTTAAPTTTTKATTRAPQTTTTTTSTTTTFLLPTVRTRPTTTTTQPPTTTAAPTTTRTRNPTTSSRPTTRSTTQRITAAPRVPWWEQTTTTTTSRPATTSPSTTTSTNLGPTTEEDKHSLILTERQDKPTGFLYADLSLAECQEITQLHVVGIQAEIDSSHPCLNQPLDNDYVEHALRNQSGDNLSTISQPYCATIGYSGKVSRIDVNYDCSEVSTSEAPKAVATTKKPTIEDTAELRPVGAAKENVGDEDSDGNLGVILGIVIPIAILLIVVPIVIVIAYKRRNRLKPLLGSRRQNFGGADDVYQDPAQAFNYSQMNSAYSSETIDDNAMYQDPALIHRPKGGRPHANSVAESLYQDPASLACTGPPGTPSPIRDALYATHDDPSTSSEIYADVDAVRGAPDGKTSSLQRGESHIYDMPFMEVVKPTPPPRNFLEAGSPEKPGYSHLVVTDGSFEPHNYAIIRTSRPVTESNYHDLENEVQLYDSPVYNSAEEEGVSRSGSTITDNGADQDV